MAAFAEIDLASQTSVFGIEGEEMVGSFLVGGDDAVASQGKELSDAPVPWAEASEEQ